MSKYKKIGVMADFKSLIASKAYNEIIKKYDFIDAMSVNEEYCDLIIALGGDGLMLKALHRYMKTRTPIYGMNRGSIGFLMNDYKINDLLERLEDAVPTYLHPLEMTAKTIDGKTHKALAINEVSLMRETNQAAKLTIYINDEMRLDCLIADGIILSTPAGSSAYNYAAYGPILPLDSNLLALTPICPFRPRRWRGALLSHKSKINFEVQEPEKRPVSVTADSTEFRDIVVVDVKESTKNTMTLLFDEQNLLEDRVIKEQFSV